jgi:predicted flap endonuclease-1-like 5' DNA nuclease
MNIEDIQGVGPAFGARLSGAGITTTETLLEQGAAAKGRAGIAEKTGISESLILKWVNHCDMMRISGVGPQFAELLEAAGVDTVKELRNRNAANLAAKMAEVNTEKNISGTTPSESMVAGWVEQAKGMEPTVTH